MQNKGVRQSMAWLHAWTGLVFGWLLFAIFLMGTSSYYRHQINLWMQPQLSQYQINQATAIQTASQYLERNAADAKLEEPPCHEPKRACCPTGMPEGDNARPPMRPCIGLTLNGNGGGPPPAPGLP